MNKPFFSTLAVAAVLAIAAPGWAQSPTVPSSPDDPSSKSLGWVETAPTSQTGPRRTAAAQSAENAPTPHRICQHTRSTPGWHHGTHGHQMGRSGASRTDRIANQLNHEELGRLQSATGSLEILSTPGVPMHDDVIADGGRGGALSKKIHPRTNHHRSESPSR